MSLFNISEEAILDGRITWDDPPMWSTTGNIFSLCCFYPFAHDQYYSIIELNAIWFNGWYSYGGKT